MKQACCFVSSKVRKYLRLTGSDRPTRQAAPRCFPKLSPDHAEEQAKRQTRKNARMITNVQEPINPFAQYLRSGRHVVYNKINNSLQHRVQDSKNRAAYVTKCSKIYSALIVVTGSTQNLDGKQRNTVRLKRSGFNAIVLTQTVRH